MFGTAKKLNKTKTLSTTCSKKPLAVFAQKHPNPLTNTLKFLISGHLKCEKWEVSAPHSPKQRWKQSVLVYSASHSLKQRWKRTVLVYSAPHSPKQRWTQQESLAINFKAQVHKKNQPCLSSRKKALAFFAQYPQKHS